MNDTCPPGEPAPHQLAAAFRAAMRHLAATVTIVTTRDGSGSHGIAASAIMSVTAEPPTLLVSVARSSSLHAPLVARGRFCVNVLGHDQADLLLPFASTDLRRLRFRSGGWQAGLHDLPVLPSAVAVVFCKTVRVIDHATHGLFLGEVEAVLDGPRRAPLVWYDGAQADLDTPE